MVKNNNNIFFKNLAMTVCRAVDSRFEDFTSPPKPYGSTKQTTVKISPKFPYTHTHTLTRIRASHVVVGITCYLRGGMNQTH